MTTTTRGARVGPSSAAAASRRPPRPLRRAGRRGCGASRRTTPTSTTGAARTADVADCDGPVQKGRGGASHCPGRRLHLGRAPPRHQVRSHRRAAAAVPPQPLTQRRHEESARTGVYVVLPEEKPQRPTEHGFVARYASLPRSRAPAVFSCRTASPQSSMTRRRQASRRAGRPSSAWPTLVRCSAAVLARGMTLRVQ
jgi:hypothetical protein